MRFRRIIYFCAAHNDIRYILYHYSIKNLNEATIIVFSNKSAFIFFKNLNLKNVEIHFFDNKLKNIYNAKMWVKQILEVFKVYFLAKKFKNSEIYLLNRYFELLSFTFLNSVKNNCKINLISSDDIIDEFIPFENKLSTIFWSIFYLAPLSKFKSNNSVTLGLSRQFCDKYIKNYKINTVQPSNKNLLKYQYNIINNKSFILIVLSFKEEKMLNKDLIKELINFLFKEVKNHQIVIKGHPRSGNPVSFNEQNTIKIDTFMPIEFLNIKKCDAVIGLSSISLTTFANDNYKVFSLTNFISNSFLEEKQNIENYLNKHSTFILFPKNINDIKLNLYDILCKR